MKKLFIYITITCLLPAAIATASDTCFRIEQAIADIMKYRYTSKVDSKTKIEFQKFLLDLASIKSSDQYDTLFVFTLKFDVAYPNNTLVDTIVRGIAQGWVDSIAHKANLEECSYKNISSYLESLSADERKQVDIHAVRESVHAALKALDCLMLYTLNERGLFDCHNVNSLITGNVSNNGDHAG